MSLRFQGRLNWRVLLPTLFVSAFVPASWAQLLPGGLEATSADPIFQMHLMTASTGWVWKGRHILWTNTEGRIWTDITPNLNADQRIGGVHFLDAEHGWAVLQAVEPPEMLPVSVATTIDGGKSWSVVPVPDNEPLEYTGGGFDFVDDAHGWLSLGIQGSNASSRSKLYRTSDGGATWSPLPLPPISGSMRFFADGTGWLCGGVHQDELYRTLDGGDTWTRKVVTLPPNVKPYTIPDGSPAGIYVMHPKYMGPHFSTEQNGMILVSVPVSEQKASLLTYTTVDGGDTWQIQKMDPNPAGSPYFFDSAYVNLGSPRGTASGMLSFQLHSEKGAEPTLTRLPNKRSVVLAADFFDALRGWMIMSDHSLLGTIDGGKTLNVLLQGSQTKPPAVVAPQKGSAAQHLGVIKPDIGGVAGINAYGMDNCATISPQILNSLHGSYGQEIGNKPNNYAVYGFYLGGVTGAKASCNIANNAYISQTACAGWSYLPIWDGYQAPCSGLSQTISQNLATAAAQGIGDADSARLQLLNIGLSGSIAYLDIEQYPTGNPSCSQVVQKYVGAWVGEMHAYHLYAGLYVSGQNTPDMLLGSNTPDDIWVPNYNGQPVTTPLNNVNNAWWTNTQRAHQYYGGNTGTYPAQTLIPGVPAFDLDVINGAVAEMIDPPPSCDEGCTAACYNETSQWCGSTCMNCVQCGANQDAVCANGSARCEDTQAWCNNDVCAGGEAFDFADYPANGCSSSYFVDNGCCCPASPIVIDAFGEGFHLTNASSGVKFTPLPSVGLEQLSWTDAQWHNGWLALDRNDNGKIDDLTELFGNLTSQPPGDDKNGYLALAVFDDPANGGNGNGVIDPNDSVYDHLLLWIDANHNGVSEPEEMHSLREVGVFKIELTYHESGYTDVNGNRFRYQAKVWDTASPGPRKGYDVFLTVETQQ